MTMAYGDSRMYTAIVHRWFAFSLITAGLVAQMPAELKLVSVADHADLYETESAGELTFTLRNLLDLPLEAYAIEIWTTSPGGQASRWCSIADPRASIGKEPQVLRQGCLLPVDPHTGKAVAHSSRIVELDWERGIHWRPAMVFAAHPRS
jgi:hypothetical protein